MHPNHTHTATPTPTHMVPLGPKAGSTLRGRTREIGLQDYPNAQCLRGHFCQCLMSVFKFFECPSNTFCQQLTFLYIV